MRPPGPTSLIPGRVAVAFARNRIRFLEDAARRYGDVVRFSVGPVSFALLNHPDYVRDVLVTRHRLFHKGLGLERARMLLGDGLLTSEDDRHLRQRRLMQPAFHRERVAAYADTMVRCAERRQRQWRDRETLDVAREMASLTLAIAGQTLFDADVEQEAPDIGDALNAALSSFTVAMLPFGDRLSRLPIPPARRFHAARARLDAIIYRLIAERRAAGAQGRDLLSLLVAARDVDGDGTGMSDEQIRDEAVTLILAGHETTANALAWTWHLLAGNPGAEQRLHDEVDRVCSGERLPVAQDLPQLTFTRAVLAEAMRLYPPAYLLGRRALVDYDVPGTDYRLPARTVVLVSPYLLHRDARFWESADSFCPERWLDKESATPHRYAYFPFGAGPRICIGEQFAWMEGTLVLAALARHWRFERQPGHAIELQPIVTLRPRHGLPMVAQRRAS
jgi:cytochrome P450